ncbi:MAG: tRNA (adenosine(37)-N6)-threonylcarbamoyltransferase complex ATPase subunit type 1 TsaE [Chitinophagaceae bacterium]|nr:MAG: tRNA (adenosine(37)-N6)-threonylcarbamoyltransferase complex ATPase subunit type 1 TsaE [Chitinophagaceae bacterium]
MTEEVTLDDLPAFAHRFWQAHAEDTVFTFYGPMGAGKTTLISALCAARGVTGASSPTFSIINEYALPGGGRAQRLYHMDLYRLRGVEEAVGAGVEDCLLSGAICLVEWPEQAAELFDETAVRVYVEALDDRRRRVRTEGPFPFPG